MKNIDKDNKSETTKKKSKKGLFITIGALVLIVGVGLFFLNIKESSYKEKKNVQIPNNDILKKADPSSKLADSTSILDSTIIDMNNSAEKEIEILDDEEIDDVLNTISKKNNRKPKIDNENNPENWNLLKMEEDDTSFFIIKNKITGTKLSNQYYTKTKAQEELKNFKKIITK